MFHMRILTYNFLTFMYKDESFSYDKAAFLYNIVHLRHNYAIMGYHIAGEVRP